MSSETTLIFNGREDISEFDIPSDYTKIGHGAFGKCSLTKVIIPNIAEIIGKNVLFV